MFLLLRVLSPFFFFFNDTATTEIYPLSLHDALPISMQQAARSGATVMMHAENGIAIDQLVAQALASGRTEPVEHGLTRPPERSEEHTSELQSQSNLVCRLLLEKKNGTASLRRNL